MSDQSKTSGKVTILGSDKAAFIEIWCPTPEAF
jgi:hypothetical protein